MVCARQPGQNADGASAQGTDCTVNVYYDGQRMVETRNADGNTLNQHVWGLTVVDELCQVALNADPAEK